MADLVVARIGQWAAANGPFGTTVDPFGCEWQLSGLTGWTGSPGTRLAKAERLGQHGTYRGQVLRTGRSIVLSGTVRVPDDEAWSLTQDWFASLLDGDDDDDCWGELQIEEVGRGLTRQATVCVDGVSLIDPRGRDHLRWSLPLYAPDPLRYDATETVRTWPMFADGGGRTYPLTFPRTYAPGGAAGTVDVVNVGNRATGPVVVFAGPVQEPTIRLAGGNAVTVHITVAADDAPVVVDMANKTVTQGGNSRRALTSGEWFTLPPGPSTLLYTAASGSGLATVRFRSAWA